MWKILCVGQATEKWRFEQEALGPQGSREASSTLLTPLQRNALFREMLGSGATGPGLYHRPLPRITTPHCVQQGDTYNLLSKVFPPKLTGYMNIYEHFTEAPRPTRTTESYVYIDWHYLSASVWAIKPRRRATGCQLQGIFGVNGMG